MDDTIKNYIREDSFEYNTKKVTGLIDQHISCQLPNNPEVRKLVEDLQTHKCSKTCKKKGPQCRFGFPRLPSTETLISLPIDKSNENEVEEFKKGREILKKVREHIESENFNKDDSLVKILHDLNIDGEEYKKAIRKSDRGNKVILKRTPNECYINNYN